MEIPGFLLAADATSAVTEAIGTERRGAPVRKTAPNQEQVALTDGNGASDDEYAADPLSLMAIARALERALPDIRRGGDGNRA